MRKILTLMTVFVLMCALAIGQTRTITGKVKTDKGDVLPFATVTVKGTTRSVTADANGNFSIEAKTGDVLQVSSAGQKPIDLVLGAGNTIEVTLGAANAQLEEVVVTAQGIRRRPKELGYSVAKVSSDDIMVGRSPQLAQSLSGKVSGLAVYNVNNSVDPSVKITLRGYRSMTGNNDALLVIDGVPQPGSQTMLSLLNPNDIESISVLKGGQAGTLYGSAGVNGALVITTKRGAKGKARVTFSNSTNIEEISFLPKFQDKYGSGSHYATGFGQPGYKTDYLERMKDNWRPFENQQYGDAFNGEPRIIGRQLEDGSQNIIPYSAISGERKRIWNTGVTMNNQIAVEGGADNNNYRLSFENNKAEGVVPSDKSNRTGVRFAAGTETGRLTARFNAAYVQQNFDRTTFDFYFESLNQAAHIPLSQYRDWRNNKFANPNGFYNDYYNNPYFRLDNDRQNYNDANISGSVDLGFKINKWLNLTEQIGVQNNTRNRKNTVGQFIYSDWAKNDAFVPDPWSWANDYDGIDRAGSNILGSVYDAVSTENILNNELRLNAEHDFGDFNTRGLIGFNVYQRKTKLVEVSSGSIVVPDLYNVSNRQGELGGGEANTTERKYGYYANASVGWRDMIFVEGSFRYDFTSRFYKDYRASNLYSYPYYGFDVSFILTQAFPVLKGDILNYAKLRGGWNKNGNDNIALYGLDPTFANGPGFPYGNTVGLSVGDILPDPNLKPEFVYSYEFGGEFQFLKNRVNLDVTYYNQRSEGQVLTVKIPNTTGYSNLRVNVGNTKNWGYEADLRVAILRSKDFSWDISARYSFNDNKVTQLFQGVDQFVLGGYSYASTYVIKDQAFPILRTTSYIRDAATDRVLVNKGNGYPITGPLKSMGRTIPKHILGWGTTFRWKQLSLATNFEYRGGNVMFSQIGRDMTFTGAGKWTEERTPHVFPNSAYDDGTGKIVPNTDVQAQESEYSLWVDYYRQIAENFVTKAWFIKLRDINITYTFSPSLMTKTKIFSGASVGVYGRNLFTVVDSKNYYTDPEFSFSNTNGSIGINNTTNTPPVRQYGINVNLIF
ncbi:MAG TPA: SusC/RagA family TonB-linked outer membrane protein [Chitinophagaceae bacterium]|nr:SusC/RagA family TonB-linked outer membrane protein [Chitinophagaceae bacterium]